MIFLSVHFEENTRTGEMAFRNIFLVSLLLCYVHAYDCDCTTIDVLKDILRNEILERKILNSRLQAIETSIKEGNFGRTENENVDEKLVAMDTTMEHLKQDAKASASRIKQFEQSQQAFQRAWRDHKMHTLDIALEMKEKAAEHETNFHELTEIVENHANMTNNAFKELKENLRKNVAECRSNLHKINSDVRENITAHEKKIHELAKIVTENIEINSNTTENALKELKEHLAKNVDNINLDVWENITALSRHVNDDDKECLDGPTIFYTGTLSRTISERSCQRWDQQKPHKHGVSAIGMPEKDLGAAENFCRDPTNSGFLWCYTTDESIRWERCKLEPCCYVASNLYAGYMNVTLSGRTCQRWDQHYPHRHEMTAENIPEKNFPSAENFCRDPAPELMGFPWCYTTDPAVRWEPCMVEPCCYTISSRYAGHVNVTSSGRVCQRWDQQHPHRHGMEAKNMLEKSFAHAQNFCRDPDREGLPWCYTTDPEVRYEACSVPKCRP